MKAADDTSTFENQENRKKLVHAVVHREKEDRTPASSVSEESSCGGPDTKPTAAALHHGGQVETRKFGTFPKQIKVYRKCRIGSLNEPVSPGVANGNRSEQRRFDSEGGGTRYGVSYIDPASAHFFKGPRTERHGTDSRADENEYLREIIEDLRNVLHRRDTECSALRAALKHVHDNDHRTSSRGTIPLLSSQMHRTSRTHREREGRVEGSPSSAVSTPLGEMGRLIAGETLEPPDEVSRQSQEVVVADQSLDDNCFQSPNVTIVGDAQMVSHLQNELYETSRDMITLVEHNKALLTNLDSLRKNYELTRRLLEAALVKVRRLESEVGVIPHLHGRILHLERESREAEQSIKGSPRQKGSKLTGVMGFIRRSRRRSRSADRKSPMGSSWNSIESTEAAVCRHAEGKSESEEDVGRAKRWSWKDWRLSDSAAHSSARLSQLEGDFHSLSLRHSQADREKRRLFDELQCCKLRNNECIKELENVEAQRARLAALEEKLQQIIAILTFCRGKCVSGRTVGRHVLEAVTECCEDPRDEYAVEKFVTCLLRKLRESELLRDEMYWKPPYVRSPSSLDQPVSESESGAPRRDAETLCFL